MKHSSIITITLLLITHLSHSQESTVTSETSNITQTTHTAIPKPGISPLWQLLQTSIKEANDLHAIAESNDHGELTEEQITVLASIEESARGLGSNVFIATLGATVALGSLYTLVGSYMGVIVSFKEKLQKMEEHLSKVQPLVQKLQENQKLQEHELAGIQESFSNITPVIKNLIENESTPELLAKNQQIFIDELKDLYQRLHKQEKANRTQDDILNQMVLTMMAQGIPAEETIEKQLQELKDAEERFGQKTDRIDEDTHTHVASL